MDFPFLLFHFESILVFVCLFCFVFSLLPPWIFFSLARCTWGVLNPYISQTVTEVELRRTTNKLEQACDSPIGVRN